MEKGAIKNIEVDKSKIPAISRNKPNRKDLQTITEGRTEITDLMVSDDIVDLLSCTFIIESQQQQRNMIYLYLWKPTATVPMYLSVPKMLCLVPMRMLLFTETTMRAQFF